MAHKRWILNLDGREHVVELEHGFWSGQRVIKVDGTVIVRARKVFDTGSAHEFLVDGRQCAVVIDTSVLPVRYALYVDGTAVDAPSPVSLHRRTLLRAAGVLLLLILAYTSIFLAPTPVLQPEQLVALSGTVTERTISRGRYDETLYFRLDGADSRLRHRTDGARYSEVKDGLSVGDAITVWVAAAGQRDGGDASVWQVRKGRRMLLSYSDQAEAIELLNTLFRAGGAGALLGALYAAWRWLVRVPDRNTTHVLSPLFQVEPIIYRAVLQVMVATLGLAVLWWLCAGAVRAIELDARQLGQLLGMVQGGILLLPALSAFKKHRMPGQLESWSFNLFVIMVLALSALESWYYVPPEVLSRYLGATGAAVAAPLALLLSGPSVALALLSLVPYSVGGLKVRQLLLVGLWLTSLATTVAVATLTPEPLVVGPWLAVGSAAATWSLFVALRLVEWIGRGQNSGTSRRHSTARRPSAP